MNHAPNGSGTSNDCAMTGVGLLYYEVGRVSQGLHSKVTQARFVARAYPLKSGSRFVFCRFYTGRITKRRESYVTFAEEVGSTVTKDIF